MTSTSPAKTIKTQAPNSETAASELPVLAFPTPADFGEWLAKHHGTSRGLWLKFAKKASGMASITYAEAVDLALAWGWIDGQKKPLDASWFLLKFTRRRPKSIWSAINRDKAVQLIASGAMQASGLAEVERAKADGRWDAAYASAKQATVPDDLAAALAANPKAAAFFATLKGANRYAILFRVQTAKKAETRAARIEKFVGMLERHETLHS